MFPLNEITVSLHLLGFTTLDLKAVMELTILITFIGILISYSAQGVMAQEQKGDNISGINEVNRNLERIYQHLDEDATQTTVGTYISTVALFVSLALVIFGFQLSREGKLSRKSITYCRVLVLSLIIPVPNTNWCCLVLFRGLSISRLPDNNLSFSYSMCRPDLPDDHFLYRGQ